MTVETKPRFKWPCWLIGHRPDTQPVVAPMLTAYQDTCRNCHKVRYFTVDNTGRHTKEGWKVPTTS